MKQTMQQGDVLFKRMVIKADDLKLMKDGFKLEGSKVLAKRRCVIAHGESGHTHVLEEDEAELIQLGEKIILKLMKQATVKHEEHKPITLEPGYWEIGRVREFDWFTESTRRVVD